MRGTILSQTKHRMEFCDLRGTTRIFWRTKGGFWLGENARLYMVNRLHGGRQGRYEEVELMSIGRSHGFRVSGHDSREGDPRPVKDRMAGDHLRHLYKEKGQTLADIAERYDASRSYILKLLREYDIAGRPPGRRPIQEDLGPGGYIPKKGGGMMEKPIEQEEIEISQELYDELSIHAKRLGCTEEELLERVIVWMIESAPPGALGEPGA